ncbi:MAG: riboflavin synthase [Actinomycetota bacterium]
MFSGIVAAAGTVLATGEGSVRIAAPLDGMAPGDSIAVDGVCLTAVEVTGGTFTAYLSEETLARTTLGGLRAGMAVNLELPLAAGGRFGGHVVQGHVDGVTTIAAVVRHPGSATMSFRLPGGLARYLVEKGSVAVDGVSLTVAALDAATFAVALVPYTLEHTTLGAKGAGAEVNVEVDVLAKYVERLLEAHSGLDRRRGHGNGGEEA